MTELIICPLCAKPIHRHERAPATIRLSAPSRFQHGAAALTEMVRMAQADRRDELAAAERSCATHYEEKHRIRYRLWKRFGWSFLLRWPERKYKHEPLPDDQFFEPTKFMTR